MISLSDSNMTSASLLRSILGVSSRHPNKFKTLLAFSMNMPQSFNCLSCQNLRTLASISQQYIVFKPCLNSGYQQRDLSTMVISFFIPFFLQFSIHIIVVDQTAPFYQGFRNISNYLLSCQCLRITQMPSQVFFHNLVKYLELNIFPIYITE